MELVENGAGGRFQQNSGLAMKLWQDKY